MKVYHGHKKALRQLISTGTVGKVLHQSCVMFEKLQRLYAPIMWTTLLAVGTLSLSDRPSLFLFKLGVCFAGLNVVTNVLSSSLERRIRALCTHVLLHDRSSFEELKGRLKTQSLKFALEYIEVVEENF